MSTTLISTTIEPIATERLQLRVLAAADVTPAYIEAMNDPEVVGLTEARHQRWDRASVLKYIEQSNRDGVSTMVGLFLKDGRRHIGNVRLFNLHPVHRRAEMSFIIFDKTQWSKGYATEAVLAVCAYAFDVLGLHRIHADYYATNIGSARLFKKAGFAVEGTYRHHFFSGGAFVDSVRVGKINPAEAV